MLARFYDRVITGLAVTGGISLVIITIAIIIDVVLRNTGFRPSQSTSALVEYVMLYSTMAAAPWLVRKNGHVAITSFIERLPQRLRFLAKPHCHCSVHLRAGAFVLAVQCGWSGDGRGRIGGHAFDQYSLLGSLRHAGGRVRADDA